MRRSRFSEERIIGILKAQQAGLPVAELCRKHGISDAAFYTRRSKHGGMEGSDTRRLKGLDQGEFRVGHVGCMARCRAALLVASGSSKHCCGSSFLTQPGRRNPLIPLTLFLTGCDKLLG